jgi:hypothetical protein
MESFYLYAIAAPTATGKAIGVQKGKGPEIFLRAF